MSRIVSKIRSVLFTSQYAITISSVLLLVEIIFISGIIRKVKYTEIDWVAYMQEVEGYLNGTTDYTELKGQTGPLVYPAGFVYLYSAFYSLTDRGANILLAQYIFGFLYLVNLYIVFLIYLKVRGIPCYIYLLASLLAYRVHSIFVLRLFNDPIAALLAHASILALCRHRMLLASVLFSVAVSIKMNVLLYAPGLLVVLVLTSGTAHTIVCGLVIIAIQVALAVPFLATNPLGYANRAFEFSRQFLFEWTVNYRFLPESIFQNRWFHLGLLVLQLTLLFFFFSKLYINRFGGLSTLIRNTLFFGPPLKRRLSADDICFAMFISNFIGVACSRSLHYQFYIWYYYSLHYLLAKRTNLHFIFQVGLLVMIELCWNVYPSTVWSSLLLHVCHVTLLVAIWRHGRPLQRTTVSAREREKEE